MLERAVQLEDRSAAPYVALGRLHSSWQARIWHLHEFQRACYQSADPKQSRACRSVRCVWVESMDAEDSYKRAIALKPVMGWYNAWVFYYNQQRMPERSSSLNVLYSFTPDQSAAHSNLGGVSKSRHYNKTKRSSRNHCRWRRATVEYAKLGSLYEMQKRYAESAEMTGNALKINFCPFFDKRGFRLLGKSRASPIPWLNRRKDRAAAAWIRTWPARDGSAKPTGPLPACIGIGVLASQKSRQGKAMLALQNALALILRKHRFLATPAEMYERWADRDKE